MLMLQSPTELTGRRWQLIAAVLKVVRSWQTSVLNWFFCGLTPALESKVWQPLTIPDNRLLLSCWTLAMIKCALKQHIVIGPKKKSYLILFIRAPHKKDLATMQMIVFFKPEPNTLACSASQTQGESSSQSAFSVYSLFFFPSWQRIVKNLR